MGGTVRRSVAVLIVGCTVRNTRSTRSTNIEVTTAIQMGAVIRSLDVAAVAAAAVVTAVVVTVPGVEAHHVAPEVAGAQTVEVHHVVLGVVNVTGAEVHHVAPVVVSARKNLATKIVAVTALGTGAEIEATDARGTIAGTEGAELKLWIFFIVGMARVVECVGFILMRLQFKYAKQT